MMAERDAVVVRVTKPSRRWWERPWFLVVVVLVTMVPLLFPALPPLVDLPGHVGRYRVELDLAHSPFLQRYYGFRWAPMGNLGVDLLIFPLGRLFGLEPGVKLIILAIPPLTAAGFLWVAREVHGRIPPTAFLALPFIYGFPFLYGFLNFVLSVALAFLAFGLWLKLGRLERTRLRAWLFVPIAFILFFCHVCGLGFLGLMCWSSEAVDLRTRGRSSWRAAAEAALRVSPLAVPLVAMALWPIATNGGLASRWFDWNSKIDGLYGVLRDRWGPLDVSSLEAAAVIFVFALLSPRLALSRRLALASCLFAVSFVLLPRFILDSAYADVRLLPYMFALALLAIRLRDPADRRLGNLLAVLALAFFAVRLVTNTLSLAIAAQNQRSKLEALNFVPRGSRVASFYVLPVAQPWALERDAHLGGLVIARREGFSNDQWLTTSHNLLQVKYPPRAGFSANPSELVRPNGSADRAYRSLDQALEQLPRDQFDYIWLINLAPFDERLVKGLDPVWRRPGSILYRIRRQAAAH